MWEKEKKKKKKQGGREGGGRGKREGGGEEEGKEEIDFFIWSWGKRRGHSCIPSSNIWELLWARWCLDWKHIIYPEESSNKKTNICIYVIHQEFVEHLLCDKDCSGCLEISV